MILKVNIEAPQGIDAAGVVVIQWNFMPPDFIGILFSYGARDQTQDLTPVLPPSHTPRSRDSWPVQDQFYVCSI